MQVREQERAAALKVREEGRQKREKERKLLQDHLQVRHTHNSMYRCTQTLTRTRCSHVPVTVPPSPSSPACWYLMQLNWPQFREDTALRPDTSALGTGRHSRWSRYSESVCLSICTCMYCTCIYVIHVTWCMCKCYNVVALFIPVTPRKRIAFMS